MRAVVFFITMICLLGVMMYLRFSRGSGMHPNAHLLVDYLERICTRKAKKIESPRTTPL